VWRVKEIAILLSKRLIKVKGEGAVSFNNSASSAGLTSGEVIRGLSDLTSPAAAGWAQATSGSTSSIINKDINVFFIPFTPTDILCFIHSLSIT